jgi:hypothetical protein
VTRNGGGIGSPLRPMLQVTLGPADLTAGARQDPSKPLLDDLRVVPSAVDYAQFAVFRGRNGDIHGVRLEKRGDSSRLRGRSRRRARGVYLIADQSPCRCCIAPRVHGSHAVTLG